MKIAIVVQNERVGGIFVHDLARDPLDRQTP